MAAPPDLELGVAPLGLPVPTPLPLLGHWFSALPKNQEWMWIFNYISWGADLVDFYSVNVISYQFLTTGYLPAMQESQVQFLGWEDPLEEEMATHSSLENPMDRGAWQATVHGVTRVRHDLVTKPPPPDQPGIQGTNSWSCIILKFTENRFLLIFC